MAKPSNLGGRRAVLSNLVSEQEKMSNDKFQNQYLVRTDAKNTIKAQRLLEGL